MQIRLLCKIRTARRTALREFDKYRVRKAITDLFNNDHPRADGCFHAGLRCDTSLAAVEFRVRISFKTGEGRRRLPHQSSQPEIQGDAYAGKVAFVFFLVQGDSGVVAAASAG